MAIALGTKKILAIDWDRKDLRLALVRARGEGVELLKAVSVPLPPELPHDDAESFGAFVREAMRQSRISAKRAIMAVPREQVVLNTLHLPPTPPEELAAVVLFQIVKELPFAAEQATIDFAMPPDYDPAAPCTALVAAIRNDDLSFYRDVAREAGLSLERLGLRPYANLMAVLAGQPELRACSMLLVEVGPLLTEIDIVKSGSLTFSRAASVPLPDFARHADADIQDSRISKIAIRDVEPDETSREAVGRLMVDVIRSFEAYRATDSSVSVDQIVVCGATGVEAQLAESLAARFAAKAQLFSPDRALDLSAQRAKELRGFSAALGLAMAQEQEPLEAFDFLEPKKPISKRTLRLKKAPAAVMTAILLAGSGYLSYDKFVSPQIARAEAVRKRVETKQARKKQIKKFKARYEALRDWARSEQYWPDILVALTRVFPDEQQAFVSRIDFDTRTRGKATQRTSTVKLKLQVSKLGMVNTIGEALRKLGFRTVEEGQEAALGTVRPDQVYVFDTSVSAEIPLRPEPPEPPEIEKAAEEAEPDAEGAGEPAEAAQDAGGGPSP